MCPKRNILFQGLERKVEWRGLLLCAVSPTSPTEKQCTGPIPCSLQSSSDESSPSPKVGQGISSSDKKKVDRSLRSIKTSSEEHYGQSWPPSTCERGGTSHMPTAAKWDEPKFPTPQFWCEAAMVSGTQDSEMGPLNLLV